VDALAPFSEKTRAWFENAFREPTPAQDAGWPAIASGEHVLIQAPTGSGKTLAAFLYGIDRLNATPGQGIRLIYVSPLKALNYDIERNLRGPLAGLQSELRVGVRTGDTPQKERQALIRNPPDILITTPESLFLMLTSAARETLQNVETLILDEVHAVAGTKRGAHLALSVERLEELNETPFQRIGLSATQRPLEEIGRFVSGARPIRLVDAGTRKEIDLQVVVPLDDMREPGQAADMQDILKRGDEAPQQSIWPSMYPKILELVREHRSTILFVNNRRLAERLRLRLNELANEGKEDGEREEIARAHHGSLAREQRLIVEEELKAGRIPCLVATFVARARDRHGRGRPRDPGRVAQVGRARPAAHRARGPRARRRVARPHLPEVPCRPARECGRRAARPRRRHRGDGDPAQPARRARAADRRDRRRRGDRGRRPAPARAPRVPVRGALARAARERARHARRALSVRRVRGAPSAHRLGPHRRRDPRPHRRAPPRGHERRGRSRTAGSSACTS
jgi:superfamily II DNA/RNA helicase